MAIEAYHFEFMAEAIAEAKQSIAEGGLPIAEMTSEGGFPPFMIDPIDFAVVYASRQAAMAEEPAGQA